jgi:hypothetical protein
MQRRAPKLRRLPAPRADGGLEVHPEPDAFKFFVRRRRYFFGRGSSLPADTALISNSLAATTASP